VNSNPITELFQPNLLVLPATRTEYKDGWDNAKKQDKVTNQNEFAMSEATLILNVALLVEGTGTIRGFDIRHCE